MTHYVKVGKDPTYWFIKDGKRTVVESPAQMYEFGLWPIIRVTQEELEAIPFADAPEQEELLEAKIAEKEAPEDE